MEVPTWYEAVGGAPASAITLDTALAKLKRAYSRPDSAAAATAAATQGKALSVSPASDYTATAAAVVPAAAGTSGTPVSSLYVNLMPGAPPLAVSKGAS